ncbi:hypothetical protein C8R43DRAFT_691423 [Mycena crocata]|nr:hypothetical protein C8R43DRAFT_691423 [Mycena crocata]
MATYYESLSSSPGPPSQCAPSFPFTLGTDIILRSSDAVDFYLHRNILSLASPFFTDLFSVPQPADEPEIPIIDVFETSQDFDNFLRVWYPGADVLVAFDSLGQLNRIIELTLGKYDVEFVAPILRKHLQAYLEDKPVGVYAVACRFEWGDIARAAAKRCLQLPLTSLFPDDATSQLMHISAHHYQALFVYHRNCAAAASTAGTDLPWLSSSWAWVKCSRCPMYPRPNEIQGVPSTRGARAWIFAFIDRAHTLLDERPGADLTDLSFLAPTYAEAAVCSGNCGRSGAKDLATFVLGTLIPTVDSAINRVPMNIGF